MGFFQGVKCVNIPKGNLALYGTCRATKARPTMSETESCSRWAHEGEVEQWAEEEEEKSGSSVHGSENCLREY